MLRNSEERRKPRHIRRLRRICALVGVVLLLAAIAMFLSTSVTYDGHVEKIDGQHDTSGLLLPAGLFVLGGALIAFGLDRPQ